MSVVARLSSLLESYQSRLKECEASLPARTTSTKPQNQASAEVIRGSFLVYVVMRSAILFPPPTTSFVINTCKYDEAIKKKGFGASQILYGSDSG